MLMKRSFAILCIFLLSFTAAVSAAPIQKQNSVSQTGSNNKDSASLKKAKLEKKYKASDKVRILVEMKEAPSIVYAQKKHTRFKDLPSKKKKELKAEKLAGHKKVKAEAKKKDVNIKELENFTTVVNGFSTTVPFGDIKKLEAIPEVGAVHIVNEYKRPAEKPDMLYSKEIVQAQEAWRDYGYKGQGMVVGIIDTGIDTSHRDMVLSKDTKPALTQDKVNALKAAHNLPGKFYTSKVPYGYNYADENDQILDLGPDATMHGMHVAGTVGANGDESNGGIKGIAPETQLLALKVFGNDPNMPSTYADIYVKAIDDAIVLGADVLNMSLGSTAGFVAPDEPEQQAVSRAVQNGILMSISAGNSGHFGDGFSSNPLASNPDIGVSGSPGVAYDSLQVASVENNFLDLDDVAYDTGGEKGDFPYMSAGNVHPKNLQQKSYDLVYAGQGSKDELAKVDVKGKFALIKRGTISFVEKTVNAQEAGAAGVIIYNNADGFISMATDPSIVIPQLFMLKSDGDKLQNALSSGKPVSISFTGGKIKTANPEAGKMSTFSSWGLSPNLELKPEITAPGGQIYSTLNNNTYGMMSGTSMAAPHVSGGSALVLERVNKDFKLKGLDRVYMAKNILMNTSQPLIDKGTVNTEQQWGIPYSPRRQGAGVMQLHSALSTPVIVTDAAKNEAKVALKEVGSKFSFTLKAQNVSDKDAAYDVKGNIQTDLALKGKLGSSANELEAQKILDSTIKINGGDTGSIKVPAKKSVTFTVSVDLSKAKVVGDDKKIPVSIDKVFPNGYFVEGYVTLKDPKDQNPELHVPYVGFKGDWNKAPILDGTVYDISSYYGTAGAVSTAGDDFGYLGYDPAADTYNSLNVAFSPNSDGLQDDIIPVTSFLRNASKVEYSITDSSGKVLKVLRTEENVTKDYYDSGKGTAYTLDPVRKWDGKVNNRVAGDGQYYYQIKAVINYKNAAWQTFKIPVKVDTAAPSVAVSKHGNVLELAASDNGGGSGVAYYDIEIDGKSILKTPLSSSAKEFKLPDTKGEKYEVIAVDYAGNETEAEGNLDEDTTADTKIPAVYILTPEALSVSDKNTVNIAGYIEEPSGLKEFTIDGKSVPLTYDQQKKRYSFTMTKKFADGVQFFVTKATDNAGNTISFKRQILVDGKDPILSISGLPKKNTVGAKEKYPKVSVTAEDNFDEIRLTLNGSEVYHHSFKEPYAMRSIKHTVKNLELPLAAGKNTFTFEVTDLAGHKTSKTVKLTKETKRK
ncbi:lactocepin [Bacillus sp. OV322]|nr:lactocepin [Bacillus sp. OV322]